VTPTSVFRATTQQDETQLNLFLARVFAVPPRTGFLQPELMRWKYWHPREDWPAPRGYVIERNGTIVAHVGVWPLTITTAAGPVRGAHMIDWAADPAASGSGVMLVKRLYGLFDFLYSIGGSNAARKLLPALGFETVAHAWSAARPVRPVRQTLSHQFKNWKLPARFVRNLVWSLVPSPTPLEEWSTTAVDIGDTEPVFRYLALCPTTRIHVFGLEKRGEPQGHMALAIGWNQARILGVWLNRPSPEHFAAAYRLAQRQTRQFERVFEVSAVGSTAVSMNAARDAGLRIRASKPVYVKQMRGDVSLNQREFQLADTDAAFYSETDVSFLT
jgi:hypothetical protein